MQFSYAEGILSLLQTDGLQKHPLDLPFKKLEDLNVENINEGAIKRLHASRSLVKAQLSDQNMLRLCRIAMKFIKIKLNYGNYGGISGASISLI
jgi:hypothetical protein